MLENKTILYSRNVSVEFIEQYLELLDSVPLFSDDEVLSDLHERMKKRLEELSPRPEFPFDIDTAFVVFKA